MDAKQVAVALIRLAIHGNETYVPKPLLSLVDLHYTVFPSGIRRANPFHGRTAKAPRNELKAAGLRSWYVVFDLDIAGNVTITLQSNVLHPFWCEQRMP